MIELKTANVLLMLITCVLQECLVCSSYECTAIQNSCTSEEGNTVALCIHTKDKTKDHCNYSPGSDVYELKGDCNPRKCPAILKEHCNQNKCMNGGICINLIGTYSCTCKNSYHGRNCAEVSGKPKQ